MGGKRSHLVYWLLLIVWVLIDVWQVIEHDRVRESAKAALRGRARDISNTVGMVIRSRRQVVDRERIEEALRELMESDVLISVALLNRAGEVLASAGEPVDDVLRHLPEGGERWERDRYVNFNPVDLGAAVDPQDATEATPILFDDNEPPDEMRRPRAPWPPGVTIEQTSSELIIRRQLPPGWPAPATGVWDGTGERRGGWRPPPPDVAFSTAERRPPRPGFGGPPRWGRPRWISEQQWASMLNQRGLRSFVLVMSNAEYREECARDFWLRCAVSAIALVAVAGLGAAWRSVVRSGELELRLVRASETNARLREMNLAAAGLAHETRNPLNIVRGLAQLIAQDSAAPDEVRARSRQIAEEVDRVTGRLVEFIDYSRPREPKPAPVQLATVVRDVMRTLDGDREEKAVEFSLSGPDLVVEADESLLRQVLFNLMLNAVEAVDHGGRIEVKVEKAGPDEAAFEVRDNGPGVPEGLREAIFRPYFTTHKEGTGLGLAVVRQIVLAHRWEIACLAGDGSGARFRVTGMKLASRSAA